jgi:ubiquinone/menaquinone biosynthesis C-methylase UbiE
VPGVEGNIELEHRHRCLLAHEFCHGKDVLLLASGEGYGSAMLSSVAISVVGVDIARDAVSHSQRTYARQNLRFMVGSCAEIPLPNASIDVVVSFETLEHHDLHDEMMAEVKRVLRPGGLLEPISKSPEDDNEASELYEAEEVLGVVFPTDQDASLPLNPSKEALHEPSSHITA